MPGQPHPSLPARRISPALPAPSVPLPLLPSGPNSSLDSLDAPVRSYECCYYSAVAVNTKGETSFEGGPGGLAGVPLGLAGNENLENGGHRLMRESMNGEIASPLHMRSISNFRVIINYRNPGNAMESSPGWRKRGMPRPPERPRCGGGARPVPPRNGMGGTVGTGSRGAGDKGGLGAPLDTRSVAAYDDGLLPSGSSLMESGGALTLAATELMPLTSSPLTIWTSSSPSEWNPVRR